MNPTERQHTNASNCPYCRSDLRNVLTTRDRAHRQINALLAVFAVCFIVFQVVNPKRGRIYFFSDVQALTVRLSDNWGISSIDWMCQWRNGSWMMTTNGTDWVEAPHIDGITSDGGDEALRLDR